MLQFWKKTGQKDKHEKSKKNQSPSKLSSLQVPNGEVPIYVEHETTTKYLCELNTDDCSSNSEGYTIAHRSQLSKSLSEVLSDKGALGYFIQYLEAHDQLSLIKFWLDVESFRAAASTRNFDESSVTPVTREQLEVFDDLTRLSPQPSQRSMGTDCDSLFDSPSHSIDSGDNIYPENISHKVVDSYANDTEDSRDSVSSQDTKVCNASRSNNQSTVNTQTFCQVQSNVITHPLQDLLSPSITTDKSNSFVQQKRHNIHDSKASSCDKSGLDNSCCNLSNVCIDTKVSASTVNCKRTEVSKCVCNGASDTLLIDSTKVSVTDNKAGIFCDCCDVSRKESDIRGTDGMVQNSAMPQSAANSSVIKFESFTPSLKRLGKRTAKSQICNNVLQAVIDDAVRIYGKYLSLRSIYKVPVSSAIKERVVVAICKEDGYIDTQTFTEAQTVVFHVMERDHFNSFLHSEYHCKHQIDVLTSGKVTIADILYNETALFYFMEFMEQEGNRQLVEFWLAAINFQQHLLGRQGSYDPLEAQNDAMVLYDKYFSLQATSPLGFGDQIRFAVEQDICRDEGPLPDCFARPVAIVQHTLQKNFLQPFLTSQLHFKYLSELVNTIQANPTLLSKKGKSGSESSSEWNISVQNTLLATEDSSAVSRRALRNMGAKELSIDSCQLNDPDSLWKRRHHRGLSFGRINPMGRFETDVEPEPDRKEESRITKVVKKLVNMEEDKAKEEMAWQIAEMIVSDITSLTLGSGDESVQS